MSITPSFPASSMKPRAQVLVVFSGEGEATEVVRALCAGNLHPVVTTGADQGIRVLAGWCPDVAIVAHSGTPPVRLLELLSAKRVPTLVVGTGKPCELTLVAGVVAVAAGVQAETADPPTTGNGVAPAGGVAPAPPMEVFASLDAGPLRVDLTKSVAFVRDCPVELPPKEFGILVELIRHVGRPISADELARRIWPDCPATAQDVYRHVYRLRRLLGGQVPTLISNRRGFGYVLTPLGAGEPEGRETGGGGHSPASVPMGE